MKDAILLFVFGLILLIKGGDWFVDGATGIAKRFKIPDILIGATVVSIGTTLPEVMVSATAAIGGSGAMAYGNAIGSIICNTALIAGITVAIKPAEVDKKSLIIPVCFFFGTAIFYSCIAYFLGEFPRWAGLLLLATFVAYMVLTVVKALNSPERKAQLVTPEDNADTQEDSPNPLWKDLLMLVGGAAIIAVGADLLVDKGTFIAEAWGVPQTVISLTFVSLGTSLPELVTAITSLVKGRGALSLGNLIGANLFNLVLVSGVATAIAPFAVPVGNLIFGMNASLILDIPLMLIVMALLTLPAIFRGKLSKVQGFILLAIYAAFVATQFIL